MDYWLITGANRGLGEGLARELMIRNHQVISLGRKPGPQGILAHITLELRDSEALWKVMDQVREILPQGNTHERLILVNNAGILGDLLPHSEQSLENMRAVLEVNLLGPMILGSRFSAVFADWPGERHILNISSGAGRHTYAGWSSYCISKAGMDMMALSQAADEEVLGTGVKVYSVAPGIVDTGMQDWIREADPRMPWLQKFQSYKEEGLLVSPEDCARQYIDAFYQGNLPSGELSDVRRL
jgi:benzil reductase ((S)-benzoin forming)